MSTFIAATIASQIIMIPLFIVGLIGLVIFFIKPVRQDADHNKDTAAPLLRVRWNAFESVAVIIAIYLFSQLAGTAVLWLYLAAHGATSTLANAAANVSPDAQFTFMAATDAVALLMVYLFLRRRLTAPQAIGWVKPRLTDVLYTLSGFFVYMLAYIGLYAAVRVLLPGLNLNQTQELGYSTHTSGTALIPIFMSLVVLPPLIEEILMRGVLYSGLKTQLPKIWAAVITSALFAAAHLPEGKGGLLWVGALDTFTLSLVLVYLREKTGSLWPGIGLHALKNGIAFILLFVFHAV